MVDHGKLDKLSVLQRQIAYYQDTLSFSLLVKSIQKYEFQPPVRFAQNLRKFWLSIILTIIKNNPKFGVLCLSHLLKLF